MNGHFIKNKNKNKNVQDPNTVFSKKQKQKNGMSQQMIHHK